MNALFAPGFKGFLTLLQAQDTVCQDHGNGADRVDGGCPEHFVAVHEGIYCLQ